MTKKNEDTKIKPKPSDFLGKKLNDISSEEGEAKLHFSNGYILKVKGQISLEVLEK